MILKVYFVNKNLKCLLLRCCILQDANTTLSDISRTSQHLATSLETFRLDISVILCSILINCLSLLLLSFIEIICFWKIYTEFGMV
jgi:hypothetical protein